MSNREVPRLIVDRIESFVNPSTNYERVHPKLRPLPTNVLRQPSSMELHHHYIWFLALPFTLFDISHDGVPMIA